MGYVCILLSGTDKHPLPKMSALITGCVVWGKTVNKQLQCIVHGLVVFSVNLAS